MKFSEWVQPDTVAIKATAVYFGVPSQGHQSCHVILTHKNWTGSLEQVTREEPDIEKKHCIECGKPLISGGRDREATMTRDEATALFERIHKQLSSVTHPFILSLVYTQAPSLFGIRDWHVTIDSLGYHWKIASEQNWQEYKRANAILETDQDLEEYADAARAEAESELEREE